MTTVLTREPTDAPLCVLAPLRIEASAIQRGAVTADVRRTGMGPRRSRRAAASSFSSASPAPRRG